MTLAVSEHLASSGPFESHVREAIALNEERAPLYAALSGGASRGVSRRLIFMERALLPVARLFDRLAAPYHRAGIPLLEDLFAPMVSAPSFAVGSPTPATHAQFRSPSLEPAAVRRRVRAAFEERGFDGAADVLEGELAAFPANPSTDCLVRHLLESAYRLAGHAPEYIRVAQARGLASPRRQLWVLLRLHLSGLGWAAALDERARPLQARGIAILAQDLPPIPPPIRSPTVRGASGWPSS